MTHSKGCAKPVVHRAVLCSMSQVSQQTVGVLRHELSKQAPCQEQRLICGHSKKLRPVQEIIAEAFRQAGPGFDVCHLQLWAGGRPGQVTSRVKGCTPCSASPVVEPWVVQSKSMRCKS